MRCTGRRTQARARRPYGAGAGPSFFPVLLLALGLAPGSVLAADPPVKPAARPAREAGAERPEPETPSRDPAKRPAQMARWFAELASADGRVRDAARFNLMGLARADLPALRDLVQKRRPLLPSQAVVLRDIVTQMYLADDHYDASGREGFLGIRPAEVSVGVRQPDPQEGAGGAEIVNPPRQAIGVGPNGLIVADPNTVYGIVVMERMPGFAGARSLQDGDVILGIVERPNVQLTNAGEFSMAVRTLGAGTKVHFELLRQGQVVRVEVKLDPRPEEADPGVAINPIQNLLDKRRKEVDEVWDRDFAPLLDEGIG